MTIFGKFVFPPMVNPQGGFFAQEPMHSCALIVSLTFLIAVVQGTSEPNSMFLSQIAHFVLIALTT